MTNFILNDETVSTDAPAGMLALDFLRHHCRLTGTKEGCKEGDCGACVVLTGELDGDDVAYKPVTSCLMPLAELHGKHIVTVEGLNLPSPDKRNPALNPVQQAIVTEGGSQCGFCTPGIVVSLTGLLMQRDAFIDPASVKKALSGHLCRCTGYRSLKASLTHLQTTVGAQTGVDALVQRGYLPDYFRDIPDRLREIASPVKSRRSRVDFVVAGGTDIYVQKGEHIPDGAVQALNLQPELKGIEQKRGYIRVGALTTFEEFAAHPLIHEVIPGIEGYMDLIASWQICNRATLGGNIVNASPIGDMTILLLALECELILQENGGKRHVPMTSFFKGYKQLDKTPAEILVEIRLPKPTPTTCVHFEKVSKRTYLDIASVNSAICLETEGDTIRKASLAVGGVAPVPLHLKRTGAFLAGHSLDRDTVLAASRVAQDEISPISDVRGSAEYKRLLCHQLLLAHFIKLFPDRFSYADLIQ